VEGFANIIINADNVYRFFNYSPKNGFNYLALYQLPLTHAKDNLNQFSTMPLRAVGRCLAALG
jgi:hypothetical protein